MLVFETGHSTQTCASPRCQPTSPRVPTLDARTYHFDRVNDHGITKIKITHLSYCSTINIVWCMLLSFLHHHISSSYEACRDLTSKNVEVTTPTGEQTTGQQLGVSCAIVPILRSGLGKMHIYSQFYYLFFYLFLNSVFFFFFNFKNAWIGMTEAMLELMPNAAVHHIGMFRLKGSDMPVQYYNRLPKDGCSDVAYVLDPLMRSGM
jgi:uracil phosphoribosyltransferase